MFKTFPEFSKLTLADRDEYEGYVKSFPPYAHLTFACLMTWWNLWGTVAVSRLNNNLVVTYWLPGGEAESGLSLIGINKIDESICTILDHLKERGEPARLVHVPEFVISSVRYPDLFHFSEQRASNEYIMSAAKYYPLENMSIYRRQKARRQLSGMHGRYELKSLDLHNLKDRILLTEAADRWWSKNLNDFGRHEKEAMLTTIASFKELGLQNVCIFLDGQLFGFLLYIMSSDGRYVIALHVKATHKDGLGFELLLYLFAQWFSDRGVTYANLSTDCGQLRLRMFMLTLGPVNFLRKYIIEPA